MLNTTELPDDCVTFVVIPLLPEMFCEVVAVNVRQDPVMKGKGVFVGVNVVVFVGDMVGVVTGTLKQEPPPHANAETTTPLFTS